MSGTRQEKKGALADSSLVIMNGRPEEGRRTIALALAVRY